MLQAWQTGNKEYKLGLLWRNFVLRKQIMTLSKFLRNTAIESKHMPYNKVQDIPCLIPIKFIKTYLGCQQLCIPENLCGLKSHTQKYQSLW